MLTSYTSSIVRDTFNLVASSPPFTLNYIDSNKILQLDALPNANL